MEQGKPRLIELTEHVGKGGALSFIEQGLGLPFTVKRVYWTYGMKPNTGRGNHCHEYSERVIVCLQGIIDIEITSIGGEVFSFQLSKPNQAIYFPPKHWITMTCNENAILVVLASHLFSEDKLITDYDEFLALGND